MSIIPYTQMLDLSQEQLWVGAAAQLHPRLGPVNYNLEQQLQGNLHKVQGLVSYSKTYCNSYSLRI